MDFFILFLNLVFVSRFHLTNAAFISYMTEKKYLFLYKPSSPRRLAIIIAILIFEPAVRNNWAELHPNHSLRFLSRHILHLPMQCLPWIFPCNINCRTFIFHYRLYVPDIAVSLLWQCIIFPCLHQFCEVPLHWFLCWSTRFSGSFDMPTSQKLPVCSCIVCSGSTSPHHTKELRGHSILASIFWGSCLRFYCRTCFYVTDCTSCLFYSYFDFFRIITWFIDVRP